MAKRRHNKDLPEKTQPADFGGGRRRGYYTQAEIEQQLCCVAGCGRSAFAAWSACCDGNVLRPVCAEHDIELNRIAVEMTGDPDLEAKLVMYANGVQRRLDRPLELDWLTRA